MILIRTQNKLKLLMVSDFEIEESEDTEGDIFEIIGTRETTREIESLGEYSTLKKCLEVFTRIMDAEEHNCSVFEMPQDDEVNL